MTIESAPLGGSAAVEVPSRPNPIFDHVESWLASEPAGSPVDMAVDDYLDTYVAHTTLDPEARTASLKAVSGRIQERQDDPITGSAYRTAMARLTVDLDGRLFSAAADELGMATVPRRNSPEGLPVYGRVIEKLQGIQTSVAGQRAPKQG